MNNKINGSDDFQTLPSQMHLEFLEALLQVEDATYPWNPSEEQSEEYFIQLDEQFALKDVLEDELTVRSQAFYSQLDTLWAASTEKYGCSMNQSIAAKLQESLQASFAARVPQEWLRAIAQKTAQIINSKQSMAEQLVDCVQSLLPSWGEEDLLVLARPYAYAMRSNDPQKTAETVFNNVGEGEWTNLSEIEQARISLAIAYYALRKINTLQGEA
ncbi:MAG: hypothetical protein IGS49_12860 [Chlorogloeopsis fritschii C42_A2020_084]|uniref:hypothetical protein n=1 Tax=Chlorogloeopsis fritschii TaxID=1124 RepID=UPI0019E4BD85|nr:hypothetical protein [Chlorogloeopsis fritschii]MBF2006324.1 hypothetical protein [Chlorogloeopsis fritschii C42_A2020_084]